VHEYSVCCALLQQVEDVARRHGAGCVARIELRVGPLSGVDLKLLRRAWPLVAAGSLAAAAELLISAAPVTVRCTRCQAVSAARPNRLLCAACGDFRTRLVSGDEMLLDRLELAQPEPAMVNQSCA
jgi:hydrogenase nickel incorporation protein HypA/HybF